MLVVCLVVVVVATAAVGCSPGFFGGLQKAFITEMYERGIPRDAFFSIVVA